MQSLFNKSFFHFVMGFLAILIVSFVGIIVLSTLDEESPDTAAKTQSASGDE